MPAQTLTAKIESPLLYTREDGTQAFVHDTFASFFHALFFANRINSKETLSEEVYMGHLKLEWPVEGVEDDESWFAEHQMPNLRHRYRPQPKLGEQTNEDDKKSKRDEDGWKQDIKEQRRQHWEEESIYNESLMPGTPFQRETIKFLAGMLDEKATTELCEAMLSDFRHIDFLCMFYPQDRESLGFVIECALESKMRYEEGSLLDKMVTRFMDFTDFVMTPYVDWHKHPDPILTKVIALSLNSNDQIEKKVNYISTVGGCYSTYAGLLSFSENQLNYLAAEAVLEYVRKKQKPEMSLICELCNGFEKTEQVESLLRDAVSEFSPERRGYVYIMLHHAGMEVSPEELVGFLKENNGYSTKKLENRESTSSEIFPQTLMIYGLLKKIGEPSVKPLLDYLFYCSDNKEEEYNIFKALRAIGSPSAEETLVRCLEEPHYFEADLTDFIILALVNTDPDVFDAIENPAALKPLYKFLGSHGFDYGLHKSDDYEENVLMANLKVNPYLFARSYEKISQAVIRLRGGSDAE